MSDTGTVVALDYSDPAVTTPTWWVPVPADVARQRVREYVGGQVGRPSTSIDTVVTESDCTQPDDVPELPGGTIE